MRRTLSAAIFLALIAAPAGAAECGPATYTNETGTDQAVGVQLGEGYVETVVAAGDTIEYWESAPGRSWAVWDLASGDVVASGVQCGEPVVVENPVVDVGPEITDAPLVVVDDSDLVVRVADEPAPPPATVPYVAPHLPAGVWAE